MVDKLEYKFNIGDRVINKKSGPLNTGTVVAVYQPIFWSINTGTSLGHWINDYPDCYKKCVYGVLLDSPSKSVTKDKFYEGFSPEAPQEYVDMHWRLAPLQTSLAFPEDDLELLDN